jgi:hypothetical protein
MTPNGHAVPIEIDEAGRAWQIGTDADIAWIAEGTTAGLTITSAIPAVFAAYATIVVPSLGHRRDEHDRLVMQTLTRHTAPQDWWLGYLDTGTADLVFPDAPAVLLYADWRYVLIKAGPDQARAWRGEYLGRTGPLPDLMFPVDKSWLLSALWDDDWRCLGGAREMIEAFMNESALDVREVQPGQDATPPGHVAR